MKIHILFSIASGSFSAIPSDHELYEEIFQQATGGDESKREIFDNIVDSFTRDFPVNAYASFLQSFSHGLEKYSEHDHHLKSISPKCEKRSHRLINGGALSKKKTFPGGVLNRMFGFDLGKYALEKLSEGTNEASGTMPTQMLMMLAIQSTVGMIQTIISDALIVVPPLVPPPVWINQPLPCLPMVTGHNCFGAILYPITLADFSIASVTDKSVDGYIANFPKLFYSKVGTNEDLYKPCFSAYMSMHCASIFPMCTTIFAREEQHAYGVGTAPMCFMHCILPLVMCPGMWLDDILQACSPDSVGLPPMCAMATFWRMELLPPMYASHEDSQDRPKNCPRPFTDEAHHDLNAADPRVYSELSAGEASPILAPSRVKSFLRVSKVKAH